MSACRQRKSHHLFLSALIAIVSLALAACDSKVKVQTNDLTRSKRANANIHNRNRRHSQSQQQEQPQVSLDLLPPESPFGFALGAGDRLGRSVFAHYAESLPSQAD